MRRPETGKAFLVATAVGFLATMWVGFVGLQQLKTGARDPDEEKTDQAWRRRRDDLQRLCCSRLPEHPSYELRVLRQPALATFPSADAFAKAIEAAGLAHDPIAEQPAPERTRGLLSAAVRAADFPTLAQGLLTLGASEGLVVLRSVSCEKARCEAVVDAPAPLSEQTLKAGLTLPALRTAGFAVPLTEESYRLDNRRKLQAEVAELAKRMEATSHVTPEVALATDAVGRDLEDLARESSLPLSVVRRLAASPALESVTLTHRGRDDSKRPALILEVPEARLEALAQDLGTEFDVEIVSATHLELRDRTSGGPKLPPLPKLRVR